MSSTPQMLGLSRILGEVLWKYEIGDIFRIQLYEEYKPANMRLLWQEMYLKIHVAITSNSFMRWEETKDLWEWDEM